MMRRRGLPLLFLLTLLGGGGAASAQGGDLVQQFVRFLFPISGREERVSFIPLPYWGEKKPQYERFAWKEFESEHFRFFAYPSGEESLQRVVRYLEEDFSRNDRIFGVESRFTKKVPILFYQSRRGFEQTHVVGGPVPESLGGLTEIFSWKRVTFPYEGEEAKLEHVAKHEATHVYQIAKGVRKVPLWFIEGLAETNSIYWDSQAEMTVRDAYVNGYFPRLDDLWQFEGTFVMYKVGNFITNLIWDEYGEAGFRKIFDRAGSLDFEENLKESLGLTVEDLDHKIQSALADRYGDLLDRTDLLEEAKELRAGEVLLHARGPFFLSGGSSGPRNALYLNHVGPDGKVKRKRIVSDRRFNNESLEFFQKGAWMDGGRIVYPIKRSERDELRVVSYKYDGATRTLDLGRARAFSFPEIESMAHPILAGETRVVFVGFRKGNADLFLFDWSDGRLETLTTDGRYVTDVDYSSSRNEVVFSREDQRAKDRLRYDRNLYLLNLGNRELTKLTDTPDLREEEPRFSPDGGELLYLADPDGTYDLFTLDLTKREPSRLTRMRVGVRHPQWGEGNSILFNGYAELEPTVYRHPRPTPGERLEAERPAGRPQRFRLERGRLLAAEEAGGEGNPAVPDSDGLYFAGRTAALRFEETLFGVQSFAPLGNEIVLKGVRGDPARKEAQSEERPRYWVRRGDALVSLDSAMVERRGLRPSLVRRLEELLSGRPVIEGWTSADGRGVLAVVNNRLARESKEFRDRDEVGLVWFDPKEERLEEWPEGPVREVSDRIPWVSFLTGGRVLLAMGEGEAGPFALEIYDRTSKRFTEIAPRAEQFRVSVDRSRVVFVDRGVFYICDGGTVRRITGTEPGEVLSFDSRDDGTLLIVARAGRGAWVQRRTADGGLIATTAMPIPPEEEAMAASIDTATGDIALRTRPRKRPRVPERIWVWKAESGTLVPVAERGARFPVLAYRRGYLFFQETAVDSERTLFWVWRNGIRSLLEAPVGGELLSDGALLLRGESSLVLADAAGASVERLAGETSGYAVADGTIVFSSATPEGIFTLFSFDRRTRSTRRLTQPGEEAVDPSVAGGRLVWASRGAEGWELKEGPLHHPESGGAVALEGFDLSDPSEKGGDLFVNAYERELPKTRQEHGSDRAYEQRTLAGRPAPNPFRMQSLLAAAAYDGDDVRFLVSGFADNLFSDQGFFVDAVFLGDSRLGTAGFADLRRGMAYSAFYNGRDGFWNYGGEVAKTFTLDRYREIVLYGDFEVQDYGTVTEETQAYVTPEIENRTFYVLKPGLAFSHDVTVWDRHGPVTGNRVLLKAEGGLDAGNGRLANLDALVDFRLYHEILPRFGLAHRISAGTSQGDLPSVYLLGGNLSFRGVGFDDLEGQNYWTFSEDLRVPIFDFLGGKFFDPLDSLIGFLTRYFDVRGGIYADVGSVWFNGGNADVLYSVGYFVNAPTLFGVNFRFHQGFAGETGIGFWVGSNW